MDLAELTTAQGLLGVRMYASSCNRTNEMLMQDDFIIFLAVNYRQASILRRYHAQYLDRKAVINKISKLKVKYDGKISTILKTVKGNCSANTLMLTLENSL